VCVREQEFIMIAHIIAFIKSLRVECLLKSDMGWLWFAGSIKL